MATADILNFMDIDPPTSSELLRSMVALSPEIKQEPEAEEDVYVVSLLTTFKTCSFKF